MFQSLKQSPWLSALAVGGLLLSASAMAAPKPAVMVPKANQNVFIDIQQVGDNLVAVGDRGYVLVLDAQGKNWKQSPVPSNKMLTAVYFVDANNGWAVGYDGNIVHSADGGKTWQLQRDGLAEQAQENEDKLKSAQAKVHELEKADPVDASALADAKAELDDAKEALHAPVIAPALLDVWFKDKNTGWAVGTFGSYLSTTDGGQHWQDQGNSVAELVDGYHIHSITGTASGLMVMAGEAGLLAVSHDGGATWQKADTKNEGTFFGAAASPDGSLIVVTGLRGVTYRSLDQGQTWQDVSPETQGYSLANITLKGSEVLLTGAGGMVAKSDNQGETFTVYTDPDRASIGQAIDLGNGHLVLAGESGIRHFDLNAVVKEQ